MAYPFDCAIAISFRNVSGYDRINEGLAPTGYSDCLYLSTPLKHSEHNCFTASTLIRLALLEFGAVNVLNLTANESLIDFYGAVRADLVAIFKHHMA